MVYDVGMFIFLVLPGMYGASTILSSVLRAFKQLEYATVAMTSGIFVWITAIYALDLLDLSLWVGYVTLAFVIIGLMRLGHNIKSLFLGVKNNIKLVILITISAFVLAFPVLLNGITNEQGMWLYDVNEHDGLWHAALMNTLLTNSSNQIPTFSGQSLHGYHLLLDLFGASVVQSFQISAVHLVFQLFPVLISWLLVATIYSIGLRIYKLPSYAWLVVCFSMFGGNLGYVVSAITRKSAIWESMFWAQQGISTMINLPFALSLLGVCTSLLVFMEAIKRRYVVDILTLALLMGTFLLGVKVYAGILIIISYSVWSLYRQSIEKNPKNLCFRLIILSLGIFYILPSLGRAGNAFIIEPGWFIKTMMTSSDRVNMPQWEIARLRFGHNLIASALLWTGGLALFLIGNFGVKVFGIIGLAHATMQSKKKDVYLVCMAIILSGILLPLALIQSGIAWNSIQFMYYSLNISCLGIPAFLQFLRLDKKAIIVALLLIFSLPSTIQTLYATTDNYRQKTHARLIDTAEIQALEMLSNLPNGSVLSPFDESALVPALSGKPTYFADPTQAQILLLDYKERQTAQRRVFIECMSENQLLDIMRQNYLTYIYYPYKSYPDCVDKMSKYSQLTHRFNNNTVSILELK